MSERWSTFLGKVKTRLGEILEKANAGLDEIIATEVIDPGPVAAATNEVKGRLFALREKIDVTRRKLEAELTSEHEAQGRALEAQILQAIVRAR